MSLIQRNIGFDGRVFLDAAEWLTYCRRKPVRYIPPPRAIACQLCGLRGSPVNPLQSPHIIGFDIGVIDLGLTPEFLHSEKNIMTAHRRLCNKRSELDLTASKARLRELGVQELPEYLPVAIPEAWAGAAEPAAPVDGGRGFGSARQQASWRGCRC
jgi:hypothetical protein